MSDVTEDERRRTQGRSPPFPFIPLERALERARELDIYSRGHPVRLTSAVSAWSYNPKSSGGIQTIAALKAFGLLAEVSGPEGRRFHISDSGRRLLRNPPEPVRLELLRKAALTPRLINEFWGSWGPKRPPDDECLWTLQDQRGFTPDAANRFLSVYDATIAYAELAGPDIISDNAGDIEEDIDSAPVIETAVSASSSHPSRAPERQVAVTLAMGERIVFTEESQPNRYLKLVARGTIDDGLLDALEDFVKRQRRRVNSALHRDRERWQEDLAKCEEAGLGDSSVAETIRNWIREADQILDTP